MKFQAFNTLLAVVLVMLGESKAIRIPVPVPKPNFPDPVPAVPVPKPGPRLGSDPPTVPVPGWKPNPIPDLPDTIPVANGPEWNYPLGKYSNNRQAPFEERTDEWDRYFSKVNDILEAAETAKANNDGIPGDGSPQIGTPRTSTVTRFQTHCSTFAGGESSCVSTTTTYTVTTALPTQACEAWSSLSVYCGGEGTECACYSGTYYVPDQWNTLAAVCAQAVVTATTTAYSASSGMSSSGLSTPADTIAPAPGPFRPINFTPRPITIPEFPVIPTVPPVPQLLPPREAVGVIARATEEHGSIWLANLVEAASSLASYCPTAAGTPTYAFGAMTPTPSGDASDNSAKPDSAPCSDMNMLRFRILVLALSAVLFGQLDLW